MRFLREGKKSEKFFIFIEIIYNLQERRKEEENESENRWYEIFITNFIRGSSTRSTIVTHPPSPR